jgi:hypothetical protein
MKKALFESEEKLILIVFVLLRFFPWALFLVNYGPQIAPDSGTYRFGFLDTGPVLSHRGPGITIPYLIMPNDLAISVIQWTFLTYVGVKLLKETMKIESKWRYLMILGVFSVLNSPTVSVWDIWILSHSLAISYNLMALYFVTKFCREKTSSTLLFANLFIFLSSVTRPNNLVFLLIFSAYSGYILFRKRIDFRKLSKRLTAIFLLALVVVSIGVNAYERTKWSPKQPIAILPYILQEGVPVAPNLIFEAKSDPTVPKCTFPDKPLTSDNFDFFVNIENKCPDGFKWLDSNFSTWYLKMFLLNPDYAFSQFSFGAVASLAYPTDYGSRFVTFVPSTFLSTFMGSPTFQQRGEGFPLLFWLLVAMAGILYKPKVTIRQTRNPKPSIDLNPQLALVFSMTISTIVSIVYQSHGDSFRLYIDNQVLIILTLVLLVTNKISSLRVVNSQ